MKTFVLTCLLMTCTVVAQDPSWESLRDEARSRYEILMLMIKNEQFDDFLQESKSLLSMPFPEDKHDRVVESVLQMSDALVFHERLDLASALLGQCEPVIKPAGLKADIVREQAYIFKKMGRDEEAMAHFKKALLLEKKAKP